MPMVHPISRLRPYASPTLFRRIPCSVCLYLISSCYNPRQQEEQRKIHGIRQNSKRFNVDRAQLEKNRSIAKTVVEREYSTLTPLIFPTDISSLSLTNAQATGTVAASQANFMRVIVNHRAAEDDRADDYETSTSKIELLCVVKAVLKKIKRKVLVGDEVLVGSIDWVDRRGMIENVFQRKTEVTDPPLANVDHLLVVFSLVQPKIEPFVLTRFLVEAESSGIPFTLLLNKIELADENTIEEWRSRLENWGYKPLFISVKSGYGISSLSTTLKYQKTVIVGPSGVGKSSLINALRSKNDDEEDNWFDPILGSSWFGNQRVGEVSAKNGKGKHTTRNVSLLQLPGGGYLADTPGLNQPSLLKVTRQSLPQAFPEIRRALEEGDSKCAFKDCLHIGEPGCVVKGDWERFAYYFQLLDEMKIREEFQLRMFGTKKEADVRYKVGNMGVQIAEPRLQKKKHRRQSRKKINQSVLDEVDEYIEGFSSEDDDFLYHNRG